MSDLSPKCAPKRTSADHLNLWVHALTLEGIPIENATFGRIDPTRSSARLPIAKW
jgi:hypothetical protein